MTRHSLSYNEAEKLRESFTETYSVQDPPEDGKTVDDWPTPDVHIEATLPNSLRDAVRKRSNKPNANIKLYIREESDGYSEYTWWINYHYRLYADGVLLLEADSDYEPDNINKLLDWLDETDG